MENFEFDSLLRRAIEQRSDAAIPKELTDRVVEATERRRRRVPWLWLSAASVAAALAIILVNSKTDNDLSENLPTPAVPAFYSEINDKIESRLSENADISNRLRNNINQVYSVPEQ